MSLPTNQPVGSPPGTLYPSLEGVEPGTEPNQADPLPPQGAPDLLPDTDAMIPARDMSPTVNPLLPPSQQNVEPVGDDATRRPRRSLQDRINQLTRQRHDAENLAAQRDQQIQALTQQMMQIQQQQMARPSAVVNPAAQPQSNPFDQSQVDSSPLTPESVRRVVHEAIRDFSSVQERQRQEREQLLSHQQESFRTAAEDFPELDDPQSPVHQMFTKVYARSPLKHLPDAPYQIALQVRGLLADEAQSAARQAPRKVAATVHEPSPGVVDVGGSNVAAAAKQYEALNAKMRREGRLPFAEYKAWRGAREVLKTQSQVR